MPFLNFFFFFFLSLLSNLFQPLFADVDSRKTPPLRMTTSLSNPPPPPPPLPPPLPDYVNTSSPFKPSIAIIVGVLTAMFSITLLLLLYAKHCKRANGVVFNGFHGDSLTRGGGPTSGRKNSGIDRAVIESLPVFRFSSLRGQKDGLECAVCLTKFESAEVLRLLPKCKHAFHVECVDTWLDAHSTCPLCRHRVDPEDILLIDHDNANILHGNHPPPPEDSDSLHVENGTSDTDSEVYRRISGRHSSAGERASNFLSQIVIQRPSGGSEMVPSRFNGGLTSFARRSLDSFCLKKKSSNNESVVVGCFDRYQSHQRKDGLLLLTNNGDGDGDGDPRRGSRRTTMVTGVAAGATAGVDKTRFEHRIIISGSGFHHRWSDVRPSDLLYIRSEMIIFDNHRLSSVFGSRPSVGRRQMNNINRVIGEGGAGGIDSGDCSSGRSIINCRSVSEITGLSRFSSSESNNSRHHRERRAGVVSRWLAWISSQSQLVVRHDRTTPSVVAVV
ncbi:hypothetical protein JCGZ_11443 [Jatropha curcas]|uniref:RING-type E3 ubiquitin transferase n=1 Tax=Jatropha curcas TaxID=180498 RepID=A0A067K4K2_JATCU|nr:hypothetical protein JCGZ_11443 [Jatropha curcas]